MTDCIFVSDLHGSEERYRKLFAAIIEEAPEAVFAGGDLLPSGLAFGVETHVTDDDFVRGYLAGELEKVKKKLGERYPKIFVILGNDDPRSEESSMLDVTAQGLWEYVHNRRVSFKDYSVFGYSYVPPTPFQHKDWERYDVSRYVDPGCVSPEDGSRSVPVSTSEARYSTISTDLHNLAGDHNLERSVFLFHSPPYKSSLDRAALDGKMIDHVPLDLHVGSIGIKRFIEEKQPSVTLHGHIHESVRITGNWREKTGRTHVFGAAHDEPQLCLVRFELEEPGNASRELL